MDANATRSGLPVSADNRGHPSCPDGSAHGYKSLLLEAFQDWVTHRASSMGAALAFYAAFSIAPILVIAIAIAGSVFGPEAARG